MVKNGTRQRNTLRREATKNDEQRRTTVADYSDVSTDTHGVRSASVAELQSDYQGPLRRPTAVPRRP